MEGLKIRDIHTTIRLIFMSNNGFMYKLLITFSFLLLMFKVRYVLLKSNYFLVGDKHCLQFTPRTWHPIVFIMKTLGFYFAESEFYMELKNGSRLRQNIFGEIYIS